MSDDQHGVRLTLHIAIVLTSLRTNAKQSCSVLQGTILRLQYGRCWFDLVRSSSFMQLAIFIDKMHRSPWQVGMLGLAARLDPAVTAALAAAVPCWRWCQS